MKLNDKNVSQFLLRLQNKEELMQNNFEAPLWLLKMVVLSLRWWWTSRTRLERWSPRVGQTLKVF